MIQVVSANIVINEIMYNPPGSDDGREWIEIYNNGSNPINLEGWKFYEDNTGHGLTLINGSYILNENDYALITDDYDTFLSDYSNFNRTLLDSSWDSLSNSGEYMAIKNSSLDIIDEINYSTEFANGNGKSLERFDNNWYGSLEDMGTPGRKNSITGENQTISIDCDLDIEIYTGKVIFENKDEFSFKIIIENSENNEVNITLFRQILNEFGKIAKRYNDLSTIIKEDNKKTLSYHPTLDYGIYLIKTNITYSSCNDINLANNYYEKLILIKPQKTSENKSYSSISINEFLPNPAGYDDAPMPGGEWVELYNSGNESIDVKGLILNDDFGNGLEITEVNVKDSTIIDPDSLLVIYRNGNGKLELNNNGFDQVILSYQGAVIDSVSYSDAAEGNSYAYVEGIGWQHTKPTPNEENVNYNDVKDSHFKIESISDLDSDNETEFGDIIKVNFHVYKGDTTKSSIKLYIENDEDRITKITKAALHNKFTNYSLTLPIPIRSNCNEKYADGDYYVKVGWTAYSQEEDSFKIKVKGINMKNCDKIYVERKPRRGTLTHNLVESPAIIEINKDFTVKVELTNNDGEDHLVDLYSYVYRGPKSYSGDREANKKIVLVKSGETKEFELNNLVSEAEPGDYKLKIKIKRDDQKTEKEIIQEIKVIEEKFELEKEEKIEEKEERIDLKEKDKQIPSTLLESIKQPQTVYKSTTIKAKELVVYLFIGLLVIYGAVLTWRR